VTTSLSADSCLGGRGHVGVDEVGDGGLALGECDRALLVGAVGSGESLVVLAAVLSPGEDDEELNEGVLVFPVAVQVPADGATAVPRRELSLSVGSATCAQRLGGGAISDLIRT
jgi:hypothetical protein